MPMTTVRPCFMSLLPPGDLLQVLEIVLLLMLVVPGECLELRVDHPDHQKEQDHPYAEQEEAVPSQQHAQGRADHQHHIDQRRNDEGEIVFFGPEVGLGGRPASPYPAHLSPLLSPPRPSGRPARASPPRAARAST